MNVTMTEAVMQRPEFAAVIAAAEPAVRAEVTAATANAEWDYSVDERGRPLLVLKLADGFDGRATGRFALDELQQEPHLRDRLRQLQGSLLRVGNWCHQTLPALYRNLRQWAQAMAPPSFVQDVVVQVNEQLSGPYEAPALDIWRGTEIVRVRPIAIWVVAAEGRVDLVGPSDSFILVLRKGDWFAIQPTNRMSQDPLSEERFRAMFEALLA